MGTRGIGRGAHREPVEVQSKLGEGLEATNRSGDEWRPEVEDDLIQAMQREGARAGPRR